MNSSDATTFLLNFSNIVQLFLFVNMKKKILSSKRHIIPFSFVFLCLQLVSLYFHHFVFADHPSCSFVGEETERMIRSDKMLECFMLCACV